MTLSDRPATMPPPVSARSRREAGERRRTVLHGGGHHAWNRLALGLDAIDQEKRPLGAAQEFEDGAALFPGEIRAERQAPLACGEQELLPLLGAQGVGPTTRSGMIVSIASAIRSSVASTSSRPHGERLSRSMRRAT